MIKLGDFFDPRRVAYFDVPVDEEDFRELLKAARKLFESTPDREAHAYLKMPIDTHDAVFSLVRALVAEIDRIKQEAAGPGAAHDPGLYHHLRMANLIERGLEARTEALVRDLTLQILTEADKVASAKRRKNGGKGGRKPDRNEQEWAASQIEQLRLDKPGIRVTEIADALAKRAKKERRASQRSSSAWRGWLYRNNLLRRDKRDR